MPAAYKSYMAMKTKLQKPSTPLKQGKRKGGRGTRTENTQKQEPKPTGEKRKDAKAQQTPKGHKRKSKAKTKAPRTKPQNDPQGAPKAKTANSGDAKARRNPKRVAKTLGKSQRVPKEHTKA